MKKIDFKTKLAHILLSIYAIIVLPFILLSKVIDWGINIFVSAINKDRSDKNDGSTETKKEIEPVQIIKFKDDKERSTAGKYLYDVWFGPSYTAQNNRVFVYFLLPSFGSFILFVFIPFINGLWLSLTDWTIIKTDPSFIGLENYKTIFSDYKFVYSFTRTVMYSVLNILAINLVAFGLALLVVQKFKLKNLYRAAFFMPNLIGGLVLGYIWQFIFNKALESLGGIFSPSLITNGNTALLGLIIVISWQYAGYIMMIYIAALQNVPQDLVEASKIDGANAWQRLKTITLPLIAQSFTIAMFLTLTTSFKQFDTVVSLTQGGPATKLPLWL